MQEQQKARFLVNKVTLLYIHAYLEIYKVNRDFSQNIRDDTSLRRSFNDHTIVHDS